MVARGSIAGRQRTAPFPGRWENVDWWLVSGIAALTVTAGLWFSGLRVGMVWAPMGGDFTAYREAAASWLSGSGFYHPYQLAPYDVWVTRPLTGMPILYPPTVLLLLVPFTVLPGFLWWALPIGLTVWALRDTPRSRLPLILALVLWPPSVVYLWTGNPAMWMLAILALATRYPGFAPWVLLKPSLAPFALYRIHRREWWVGAAFFALVSVAFLPLWLDYPAILLNSGQGLLYSLWTMPIMLVPLVSRP